MAIKIKKDWKDLKDSRLLYEKNLPLFGYFIIVIILMLLIGIVIWSLSAHKSYLVKGSGTVVSDNKNYIMSDYTGKITEIKIEEGAYVEKGEPILVIKSTDLELQREQITGKMKIYQKTISQLEKLEKSIKNDRNYFNATSADDKPYYNQYLAYKSNVAQNQIDASQYKNYGYTDEQIENEVKKSESKVSELYYTTLKGIADNMAAANDQFQDLEIQLSAVNNGQKDYVIKANASGIVHMMADYKAGMVVQAANSIASIANENDKYYINSYIAANDMPLLRNGNDVQIAVSGLNESVYGTLTGNLIHIDSDVTTDSNSGKSFFKIKIEPKEEYLISKSGNKVNISNGMAVETRVNYDEVTYFDYVMESLGVLTK